MGGRKRRVRAARTALQAIISARGSVDDCLAAVEVLRARDRQIHKPCEQLIRAGNPQRCLALFDEVLGPLPPSEDAAVERTAAAPYQTARTLSLVSWLVWLGTTAFLWLAYPGTVPSFALLFFAWCMTGWAVHAGGKPIHATYEHYMPLLENLGALVFLLVPVMLPIGFIWTIARAVQTHRGLITGAGHDPHPGGGYGRFDKYHVGRDGRPLGGALFAVALCYPAALAALVVHSGIIEHMSFA
jgi:hypothetical protein